MKRSILAFLVLVGFLALAPAPVSAAPDEEDSQSEVQQDKDETVKKQEKEGVFYQVLFGSGWLGTLLWFALLGSLGFFIYLAIDCGILIRTDKVMPSVLVGNVQAAMKEGDVVKALQFCENEPTPMSNVLSAGFTHVEEGFDVIQEAVSAAADLEVEKIMQRLAWLSVCANIAPSLGLLGTVQGMIMAFANLGDGQPDVGSLATNISQALWTTAGGLVTSIPAVCFFYLYRGKANKIILQMEATTMELIKDLRNVEVVAE